MTYVKLFEWAARVKVGRSLAVMGATGFLWFSSGGESSAQELVAPSAAWKYFPGLQEASSPTGAWRNRGFEDGDWAQGPAPFRYGTGEGGTVLESMEGRYSTLFLRHVFQVADTNTSHLNLEVDYDDGFIAWINGIEVLRQNAPVEPTFDALATQSHKAGIREVYEISDPARFLVPGPNVLAVQGFNLAANGSTFYFQAGLAFPQAGVQDTKFTRNRGFYQAPIEVSIASETPGAVIHYTLDGSTPTPTSGLLYEAPLSISGTTILRALAFAPDHDPTDVDTQTYLFLEDVLRQPAVVPGYPRPLLSVGNSQAVELDYEMDPEVVDNPAYLDRFPGAMEAVPTISIVGPLEDLFGGLGVVFSGGSSGDGLESKVSVEFLYPDEPDRNFQVHAGVRPHSHRLLKRSLRLLFRSALGDAKLRADIFRGAPLNGEGAAAEFDRLVLRGGGNRNFINFWNPDDSTYTRDEWTRASQIAMSGTGSHGHFAHLYINGLYWGLYNFVERPDHFFAASYFGGEQDDYFAVNHGGIINGDPKRWNYLKGELIHKDMSLAANYQELREYLDIDHFCDYLILNFYAGMTDWPGNNWYAIHRLYPEPGPIKFYCWDAEDTWDSEASTGPFDAPGNRGSDGASVRPGFHQSDTYDDRYAIANIFNAAKHNREFMLRFADRTYHHLFHDGALTDSASRRRWMVLNEFIEEAIYGESARWGDAREFIPGEEGIVRTPDGVWQSEVARVHDRMSGNGARLISALRNEGYYPSIDPPEFNRHGGTIAAGFALTMTSGAGTIWYTTDGSDPRLAGGAVASVAQAYEAPVVLEATTRIKARLRTGEEWSALHEALFVLDEPVPLRITEIMYNPADPTAEERDAGFTNAQDFEFLELQNVGNNRLVLTGIKFVDGIEFEFPDGFLEPGARLVLVKDAEAIALRYGDEVPVAGEYSANLSNGGERIQLAGALGEMLLDFEYRDSWYGHTDGEGFSLVLADGAVDPAALDAPESWRPSHAAGGTPGTEDPGLPSGVIAINEIMTNTSSAEGDWIELANTGAEPVAIGGWYLSDDPANLRKYRIAEGTVVPGSGMVFFTEAEHFGIDSVDPGRLVPFGLSAAGGELYLTGAEAGTLTGYRTTVSFGGIDGETTFGIHVTSTGRRDFTALERPTPGAVNAPPLVGPVVIDEIMFDPVDAEGEFLELFNRTDAPISLYDTEVPANTWKFSDGIEYFFPAGSEIPAHGYVVLVSGDPQDFRDAHEISPAIAVLGPYTGRLDNGGERLALSRPGRPEPDGSLPYIVVDHVTYSDQAPWPNATDGGPSIARVDPSAYGNDPAHWERGLRGGSPGTFNRSPDLTPPTVPGGVRAAVIGPRQIRLEWLSSTDAESGLAYYVVYRNGERIGTTMETDFLDAEAIPEAAYTYGITAVNQDGEESAAGSAPPVNIMTMRPVQVVDPSHIRLRFSESIATESVGSEGFSLAGAEIISVRLEEDPRNLLLRTSPLESGTVYVLTVTGIIGRSGGVTPPEIEEPFLLTERVVEGLLALFDFEEESGVQVHDVSGVDPPLDLTISDPDAATWHPGSLAFDALNIAESPLPAAKIIQACQASQEISIEAWLVSATVDQSGPARIVTLSADTGARNFTLGQNIDQFDVRLRTTTTGRNGTDPSLASAAVVEADRLIHVVYTRDSDGHAVLYVDNAESTSGLIDGDFSSWDESFRFGLANELTQERPWRGELYLVAVYDRALTAAEVDRNYQAGPEPHNPLFLVPELQRDPADSSAFLTITYPRRLVPTGFSYQIEISENLLEWTLVPEADIETLEVAETIPGVVERVRVRLHPALEINQDRFVRIRRTPIAQ